jgi:hypothetical protein
MGNKPDASKSKPFVLNGVPFSRDGAAHAAAFEDKGDHETATLTDSKTPNAYYLPWRNNDCTSGSIALGPKDIGFFFTAPLTGCSLWVKVDKNQKKILLLHEARTDTASQQAHQKDDYTLIIDSNAMKKSGFSQEAGFTIKGDVKTVVYFEAYAILDYAEKVMEFRIQMIQTVEKMGSDAPKSYKLMQIKIETVPLPV